MSSHPPDAVRLIAMSMLLAAALYQDVLHRRIPNTLILAGAMTGLGLSLAPMGIGLGSSSIGGMVGLLGFGLFYIYRLLGAGDVKLVSAVGFFTGYPSILMVSVSILLAGGLLSIVWGAWTSQLLPAWANLRAAWQRLWGPSTSMPHPETVPRFTPTPVRVPYAIAIAAGAWWQMAWPWHLL
jgi:prepilin peptidase CpaA